MKKLLLLAPALIALQFAFAQHQFYVGVHQGGGYIMDVNRVGGLQFGSGWNGSGFGGTTHTLKQTIHGGGASTKVELLYGYKKFRIGYRFDYMYFAMKKSVSRLSPPEPQSNQSVFKSDVSSSDNIIGNSLTLEYLAFEKGKFSISPNIHIGYFNRLDNPNSFSFKSFVQTGAGIMFGYKVGPVLVFVNPEYTARIGKEQGTSAIFGFDDGLDYKLHTTHSIMVHVGVRIDLLPLISRKASK